MITLLLCAWILLACLLAPVIGRVIKKRAGRS